MCSSLNLSYANGYGAGGGTQSQGGNPGILVIFENTGT
jgi:hypothetical protein